MALRQNVSLQVGLLVLCLTWGVRAMLEVVMEDRVEVMRGDTAQITCMFTTTDGIGGLIIQWFYTTSTGVKHKIYSQDTMVNTVERGTQFTDRISVNSTLSEHGEVVLTISDVQLYDEQGFICHIRSLTDGDGEGRTQLRVFATPEYPTIEAVHTGIWLSSNYLSKIGSCQAKNGYPRANITWYRDSTPLLNVPNEVDVQTQVTRESSGLFSVKSELHLMVTEEDKNSQFYCEVDYFVAGGLGMLESKKINITVFFPTDVVTVWVESPKGDIKEGDTVELQCRGNGNPPSLDLTFKHGDAEMSKDSSDNTLVLKDVTRQNSGLYQCSTLNTETLEDIVGNTTVVVNYLDPAVVIPKHTHVMFQGEGLDATCNALSSLKTKTAWFKNGAEVAKGHILTLKDAAFDTAGTYVCAVTVPQMEGMETNATLRVVVQGPPVVSTPVNTLIEERVKKTVNLSCHARGFPVPTITWSPSDAEFKPVSSKETEDTVLSVVSLEVRSDITALCNASNQFGTKGVAFSIKAIAHTTSTATTAQTATAIPPEKVKNEGSGVIIAVIIICLLLLAILGSVLYFLYKKGKICGRSGKQDLTKEKSNKENIVVEMKSDNTEEAVLLGVNGEKKPPGDQ